MSKIRTYDDLMAEKEILERQLMAQKAIIRQDIAEIKEELKPAAAVLRFVAKLTSRDNSNPLLNIGMNLATDVVLRNVVLAKSGWLTKLLVPFFAKNLGSNAIAESKSGGILKSLLSRFRKAA